MTAKKWLNSIDKQKRRIDLKEQHDRQTDRQSQSQKNNRLLAYHHNKHCIYIFEIAHYFYIITVCLSK